jgi:hypothetical protein
MDNITLKSSPDTPYFPEVNFDADTGVCEISGESYMEETYKFYLPLVNWIKDYIKNTNNKIELVIKLIYLNTSTTKCILDMLDVLKEYQDKGGDVKVIWYYDIEDPDMVDEVEDFEMESGMKIELRKFEP